MHKLDQESKVTSTKVTVQLHWLKMGPRGYFRPENSGSRRKKKKKQLLNAHSGIQPASLLYLPSYQAKPHAPVTMKFMVLNTSTFCMSLCLFMYCSLYPNYSFLSLTDEMFFNHTLILQGTAQISPPLHSALSNRIILPSCVFPQHFC